MKRFSIVFAIAFGLSLTYAILCLFKDALITKLIDRATNATLSIPEGHLRIGFGHLQTDMDNLIVKLGDTSYSWEAYKLDQKNLLSREKEFVDMAQRIINSYNGE